MAYDTPKAAHFTATDGDGEPIPEFVTRNLRWLIAGKVALEFPDLLDISLADIPSIQEICEKYSSKPIKITFQVPAYLTDD